MSRCHSSMHPDKESTDSHNPRATTSSVGHRCAPSRHCRICDQPTHPKRRLKAPRCVIRIDDIPVLPTQPTKTANPTPGDISKQDLLAERNRTKYAYDNNGSMTSRGSDSITWYSFRKPKLINYGGDYAAFTYGANRNRTRQVAKTGSSTVTTYYVGEHFEKEEVGGITHYRHNIMANGKTVAVLTRPTSGWVTTRYVHRDHQSNVVALTDLSQSVAQRYSFDAFGKRRNTDWTADTSDNQFSVQQQTERGYTGHEHLDNTRLIHMNGRIQDPIIGRVISADPYIPNRFDGQSYNRYSYVINNPLSFTDPSGFDPEGLPDVDVGCYFAWDIRCLEEWPNTDPNLDRAEELDRIELARECSANPDLPQCSFTEEEFEANRDQILDLCKSGLAFCEFTYGMNQGGVDQSDGVGTAIFILGESSGNLGVYKVVNVLARRVVSNGTVGAAATRVPGRVQSRINVSNDGFSDVTRKHMDGRPNKSQFSIPEEELRELLGRQDVVSSPVDVLASEQFVRQVDVGRVIGNLPSNSGGAPTQVISVITDKYGNLVNAIPGPLKY